MSVCLNRWLGPSGRGEVTAATITAQVLPYIASMGLGTSVLYHSGNSDVGASRTLSTALPLGVLQSVVFGSAAFLLLPLLFAGKGPSVVADARLALLGVPAALLSIYIASAFQAELRFGAFNVFRCILPVGSLAAFIALRYAQALTVRNAVVVYTFVPFLALVWATLVSARNRSLTSMRPNRAIAKRLMSYGVKAQAGELANTLSLRLDQLVIAAWLPTTTLGFYVASVSVTQLSLMVAASLTMVLQPRLVLETDAVIRRRLLRTALLRYTYVGSAVCLTTIFTAPFLIPALFGEAFREAVTPSQILAAAALVLGYKAILASSAQALGDPWLASRSELLGMAVTVLLLAILVPTLGISGAAISSALAYTAQAGLLARSLWHHSFSERRVSDTNVTD